MSAGETVLVEECNTERAPGRALKDGTPVFAPEEKVPDDHE